MRLWDLPGARRFVDSTCDLIRGGNNVVIRFPGIVPEGFDDAVSATLGNTLRVGHLQVTRAPLEDLARSYAENPDQIRRLADLCDDRGFRGRLLLLHGLDGTTWPAWREFLGNYAQASRSRSLLGRSLFLVKLAGYPHAEPPRTEVGLACFDWKEVLDEIDLLLFASEHLRQRIKEPLLRSLLATTVARVAAWDFETAAALVAEDDRTIMDPLDFLSGLARDRGWTSETPLDWHLGTASHTAVPHPARAALDNPPTELYRRLWSAQLAVLLPWVEARRHELVAGNLFKVKRQMRMDGNGQGDPFALELGELFRLFARRGGDRRIRTTVKRLRDVRNELAHRQHVTYSAIVDLIGKPRH